ncbi:MAG: hypothetical protein COA69_09520 [Robiginitomaculum sp.]|nr:MAG: hypothetical protein COA69_09520 [Robiginitomaculum sp.]
MRFEDINLGDEVTLNVSPASHPAIKTNYKFEGRVILKFKKGDFIDKAVIAALKGSGNMIGPSKVDRVVMANGERYVWAPKPMIRFIRRRNAAKSTNNSGVPGRRSCLRLVKLGLYAGLARSRSND